MTSKSAAKLIPSDPAKVMVFRDILPNMATISSPFARFGLFKVGGRATIIKLQTGALAVFSPVALTDDVRSKVQSMGNNVKYISAMDIEHHIFITPWAKAYPQAEVIGVEGLPEKREKDPSTKGITFSHVFTQSNNKDMRISEEFDEEFEYEFLHSHPSKELIYYHKPSKTMIQADFIFNLPAYEQYSKSGEGATSGVFTKLFTGLMNTRNDITWQRRFVWYVLSSKDRAGFSESVNKMKRWELQRIVPSHGDVIESEAQSVFDKITRWFPEGHEKK
ncbi:hypothetical protein EPUS_08258 [Endocarpon pusillum Z07020]|uniref:DUF4336 domain-containing protein n=1 Tax=Endocarpon pusillum (strain Z07020 / HMAS-L-300199) TaxID=1263415 RepID=U1I223_ENDPU|nr:uncharacterized protein EPUS_08258 [Endocarpon pusillum Z07020]ERF76004.1 hypothetical protein EPUS_08258 [Endocarpon pusillum Z07020]